MGRLGSALERWGLPVWFAAWSIASVGLLVMYDFPVGLDARIYHAAATAWLNGGDPWGAQASVYYYSGLPPTVLAFVPFTVLPEAAFTAAWLALTLLAAVYVVHAVGLPWWWILFPPLAEGLFSGNPQIVLLALLLTARGAILAPILKVYALVPLAGELRWRAVAVALAAIGLTVVVAPDLWRTYLGEFARISDYLAIQSNGGFSAWSRPLILVPAAVAVAVLALLDRRAAGWLAVVALWPSTQFHYSTMAMPLMPGREAPERSRTQARLALGFFAAALAVPIRGLPAVAVVGYALWSAWSWWRARSGPAAATALTLKRDPPDDEPQIPVDTQ